MHRTALIVVLAASLGAVIGDALQQQIQIPEAAQLNEPDGDLQAQIRELQRNVSDIWTYIHELRTAVSGHLTHLRQHQAELEDSVHKMEHFHEDSHGHLHSDSHRHSGEQHSHGDSHHHSGEEHSHGDEHSHGGASGSDQYHHSGEHHSHSGEHHSHNNEQGHFSHSTHSHSHSHSHDHSKEDSDHSHSHSHDHSKEDSGHSHSHDHSKEDSGHSHDGSDHSHHDHDHKDSHETEDFSQQTQKVDEPVAEPVVVATNRQEHYHNHRHPPSQSRGSSLDLMNENSFHHDHHHHVHHHDSDTRSRTIEIPKYSEYDIYDFAICNVQPNRAIPEEKQQNVGGQVILWQKKSGGPLNFHVRLQGFNVGGHHGQHGLQQTAVQSESDNEAPVEKVGHRHGFHIHTSGDLSNGCQSTGPHFNPKGVNHGAPNALVRHVGDLGNIECDEHGFTNILFSDELTSLQGEHSVEGRSMVIHSNEDDLGLGGDEESLKTGNAGTRIACCVIQKLEKLPIRYYKIMKTATQYRNY